MRRLADICMRRGYEVTGSDLSLSGHAAMNVHGADLVVYTAAAENNIEVVEAKRLGLPLLGRAEMLDRVASDYPQSIAIAGCHGKTTAVGLAALAARSLAPEVHIGGDVSFDCRGKGGLFITEACEYRRSFLKLHPDIAAILNIDLDHTDCYKDIADVYEGFTEFALKARRCVLVNGDDPYCRMIRARNVVTFGLGDCDYRAADLSEYLGRYSFMLMHAGNEIHMSLQLPGRHNVYNALCAVAAAHEAGAALFDAARGAEEFAGVKRRFEQVGEIGGAQIYTDYAHHPKEIAAAVRTARSCGAKRVVMVFEPHTYSRTAALEREFTAALETADEIVLAPIFAAREAPIRGVTAQNLWLGLRNNGTESVCLDTYCAINSYVRESIREGDFVLYTGAGTIDAAARSFVHTYGDA